MEQKMATIPFDLELVKKINNIKIRYILFYFMFYNMVGIILYITTK